MDDNPIQTDIALAGVAQWTEHQPVDQRVAGSIPRQGTCLGCGPGPWLGMGEAADRLTSLSLSFYLPPRL